MHYTRVYYWVSSWWANRIVLASLTYFRLYMKALVISQILIVNNKFILAVSFKLLCIILTNILKIVQLLKMFMYARGFTLFATTLAHADANWKAPVNAANQRRAWRRLTASKV